MLKNKKTLKKGVLQPLGKINQNNITNKNKIMLSEKSEEIKSLSGLRTFKKNTELKDKISRRDIHGTELDSIEENSEKIELSNFKENSKNVKFLKKLENISLDIKNSSGSLSNISLNLSIVDKLYYKTKKYSLSKKQVINPEQEHDESSITADFDYYSKKFDQLCDPLRYIKSEELFNFLEQDDIEDYIDTCIIR